jgi:Uma2 family endonuclease
MEVEVTTMASVPKKERLTPEQYLAMEVKSDLKHEYCGGKVFLMTGASRAHNVIAANIIAMVNRHIAGKPCEVYGPDMRVKVQASGLYTYPDASIACPPIEFEKQQGAETLLNPVAVVEVLSPSTEAYDRGKKLAYYQEVASLQEYLLVSQEEPRIDHLERLEDGNWKLSIATGLDATVHVHAIGCQLRLADVYEKVEFPPPIQESDHGPAT